MEKEPQKLIITPKTKKALTIWAIYDFSVLATLIIFFKITQNFNFIWATVGFSFIWAIYGLYILFKNK